MASKPTFRERLLKRYDSREAFETLVRAGADPGTLEERLFWPAQYSEVVYVAGRPSVQKLWGLSGKGQIERLPKTLRRVADKIEMVNGSDLGNPSRITYWERQRHSNEKSKSGLRISDVLESSIETLPELLRIYAGILSFQSAQGLKHRRRLLVAHAQYEERRLLEYVRQATKKSHYREVATLLGASFEILARRPSKKVLLRAESHFTEEGLQTRQKVFRRRYSAKRIGAPTSR